jgi:hypothetical protein
VLNVVGTRRERRKATLLFDVPRAFSAWGFPYVIHRHLCTVAKASAIGLATPSISIQPRGMEAESWPHRVLQLLKTTVNRLSCSMALEGDRCETSCIASDSCAQACLPQFDQNCSACITWTHWVNRAMPGSLHLVTNTRPFQAQRAGLEGGRSLTRMYEDP